MEMPDSLTLATAMAVDPEASLTVKVQNIESTPKHFWHRIVD